MFGIGDHRSYTTTTRDFRSERGVLGGGVPNCQCLREQHNIHHPQDCTGDVHLGFCGGDARMVGFGWKPLMGFIFCSCLLVKKKNNCNCNEYYTRGDLTTVNCTIGDENCYILCSEFPHRTERITVTVTETVKREIVL